MTQITVCTALRRYKLHVEEIKNDPTYCRRRAEEFRSKAAAATDAPLRAGLEAMARELEQRARRLSAQK